MNEITNIHLGRQAFTIAVDAYKDLQDYLHAIRRQIGTDGKDVMDEVELRMAELLQERGVSGDTVVIAEDIAYLRRQLGEPGDFTEETEDETEAAKEEPTAVKRLYRDTEHGMFAGVGAGIAAYFDVDPVLVRVLFVIAMIAGGSGFLLYIVLWLIIPEAKTPSERLQMRGKPVTIDSLKEVVGRADVEGAARRAATAAGKVVTTFLKVVLAIIGVALAMAGIATMIGAVTAGTYLTTSGNTVNGLVVFPVGTQEVILATLAILLVIIIGLFLLFTGIALVRFKWSLPGWATGVLLTLFFALVGVTTALSLDAAPRIHDRAKAAQTHFTDQACEHRFFNYCTDDN